jgi:sialate O-acetylesterase
MATISPIHVLNDLLSTTAFDVDVDVGAALRGLDAVVSAEVLAPGVIAVAASGPLPAGHEVKGGSIVLKFTHTDGGLKSKEAELKGFAIAGSDRKWVWAKARIEGGTVIVSSPEVKSPVAVRYAWADNPSAPLVNGAGLPASPFRTDDW